MSYIAHHYILVTTFDQAYAVKARRQAQHIFESSQVSAIHAAPMNALYSFCIFPDGSKEGWPESDAGDAQRAEFAAWLLAQRYEDLSARYEATLVLHDEEHVVTAEPLGWDADAFDHLNGAAAGQG